jgi:hypothetical protein
MVLNMTKKEKDILINKTNIIFILNEIQMQLVTEIVDLTLQQKFKQMFNSYWKHTRKITKEVKSLFSKVDERNELNFDINVENVSNFLLKHLKEHFNDYE